MEIIKIGAVWCPACLIMNKVWNKLEKEYSIKIKSLDIDFDESEVKKYNVGNILPVLIIKNDGIEIKRIIGEKKYEEIKKELKDIIK